MPLSFTSDFLIGDLGGGSGDGGSHGLQAATIHELEVFSADLLLAAFKHLDELLAHHINTRNFVRLQTIFFSKFSF